MRHNKFCTGTLAALVTSVLLLASCITTPTTTTTSDNATVASLTFKANDSIPNLNTAVFTINNDSSPGLIINRDSLPYLTRIDSVFPTFTFSSSPYYAVLYAGKDTIYLTGSDTVDFSVQPVRMVVVASDAKTKKEYEIYVNVHQVDPDLYVWKQLTPQVYSHVGSRQKAVWFNKRIYFFVNSGLQNYLYSSADGEHWQTETLQGLPSYNQFQHLTAFKERLYFCDDQALYFSENATNWSTKNLSSESFELTNLLYVFDNTLWAIVQDKTTRLYHFAQSTDADTWTVGDQIPAQFPIADYASVVFSSTFGRPRAMVLGGISASGTQLNTRWNFEKGSKWVNFAIEEDSFGSFAGASIIWYANNFLLFGGIDSNNNLRSSQMLQSNNEGLTWHTPDTAKNILPKAYRARTKASVVIDDQKNIYLIGGQSKEGVFTDVFKGKLNRMAWEK